ncbi:glycerol-3-phosphate 1-O-acyltransferase PlsY [Rhodoblastus acidophilus]|uniref:Glycerol-3-phosphate acyltransferase n=1 Tax=Candidatus Rhodoblastus alkanivorans TaxID=2954117 RepID=A0ABS9Z9R6_9HYPH|nr:glycerol-3-phosphate 1-O-acyltransferase PlsY [Candidatus Rhodoblastus alkanivorans]MCI4679497.1 glycerol-3-phosphate 1-O-acyltransferase PlsY [Candidatus Rhodoblastus alkanivorans]MCI4683942.1 glycerol-3-phosphate 1-O-acyltransferase PlsY [Candidatus Rhodoblastus alkanivorans]MDI4641261.1 glycerol-3-phosphate 1-O-acyltransferase PlsY [Rhodoblastus acidophilus]
MISLPLALLALLIGYGLGSIPFGLLLTKAAGLGDVRAIGSGNIGATNVLRTGRKDIAAATLLLDALKGTAAVLIMSRFSLEAGALAGFAAFLGHIFPAWLKFKGGKGVATFLGCLFGFAWPAGLAFMAIWLATAFLSKYSSLSALVASALSPVVLWLLGLPGHADLLAVMAAILWVKHRENIARLRAGTEGRIGQKK